MARGMEDVRALSVFIIGIGMMSILCSLDNIPRADAANPAGFLYIDCGSSASYVDQTTGLQWVPDDGFITTGVNFGNVDPSNQDPAYPELSTLRYFNGSHPKDCYSLSVTAGTKYLLRASFRYGQYDNATTFPTFQMAIDATVVANISAANHNYGPSINASYEEFTIEAQSSVTYLCLLRDASNTVPFISAIALRPILPYSDSYMDSILIGRQYLSHVTRLDIGGVQDKVTRYPQDKFDRYWSGQNVNNPYVKGTTQLSNLSTSNSVDTSGTNESIPSAVLQTCLVMPTLGNITVYLPVKQNIQAFLGLYFAELNPTVNATSRQFWIQIPTLDYEYEDPFNYTGGLYKYDYWFNSRVPLSASSSELIFYPDKQSTLGPSLNGLELFSITDVISSTTNNSDVSAIESIKSTMNLGDWSGDPCLPFAHSWLTCEIFSSPHILAVNLSGYRLNSTISPSFAQLVSLTSLDLSNCGLSGSLPNLSALTNLKKLHLQNNSLTGPLPDWLASLATLTELFVENNNFIGTIPGALENRSMSGLHFRYTPGNPNLILGNASTSSKSSSNTGKIVGVVLGGLGALIVVIILIAYFACYYHRSENHPPTIKEVIMPHIAKTKNLATRERRLIHFPRLLTQLKTSRKKLVEVDLDQYFMGYLTMAKKWLSRCLTLLLDKDQPSFLMRWKYYQEYIIKIWCRWWAIAWTTTNKY